VQERELIQERQSKEELLLKAEASAAAQESESKQ
jgi:hypothetical protein